MSTCPEAMTPNTKRFIKENDRSPVIAGAVIGEGGEGGHYTLMNGMSFTLNLQDCQALPEGYPKWHFPSSKEAPL